MKRRHIRTCTRNMLIIVFILISVTSSFAGSELGEKAQYTQYMTLLTLQGHYNPMEINDEFSERVFDLYLKYLDMNKRFFTHDDYNKLTADRYEIDDEIKNAQIDFFNKSTNLLYRRINNVKDIINEILKKPFDFTIKESLETDLEKRGYPKDETELKELWRKILKLQVLQAYYEEIQSKKSETGSTSLDLSQEKKHKEFETTLKEVQERVLEKSNITFNRMLEETMEEKFHLYLDAVANSYDPHTEYLPPQEKDDYDTHLSGTFYGIGATLQKEGENIEVVDIIPGGPSWKQKELQAGDIILQVAQGDEEPVDIIYMSVTEAVRLIRGKKGTTVRLTVKKPDGRIVVISIVRDLVVIEESYAKSAVIEDKKSGNRYGYIYLPSFYHDLQREEGRSSSQDVKEHLKLLKKNGVEGVILDLRNNTGGLLYDAVEMAGHFIKTGPVVQVKERDGTSRVLEDTNPEITYDGQLLILINTFSASASEILAAALQDYGRAIIVGSPRSFGKGTVQVVYVNLDDVLEYVFPQKQSLQPLGFVKYTVEKYYRITGGSTQLKGVKSDIILPDPYSYLDYGEEAADYPLPWDEIESLTFEKWNNQISVTDLEALNINSSKRLKESKSFQLVNQEIDRIIREKEDSKQSLELEVFLKEKEVLNKQEKAFESLKAIESSFNFVATGNIDSNKDLALNNENESESTEPTEKTIEWLETLSEDMYLIESVRILQDLLLSETQ